MILILPWQAHASDFCDDLEASAYFVGIVKVVEETKTETILEIIQSYIGPENGQLVLKRLPPHMTSFRPLQPTRIPAGRYYEEILSQEETGLHIRRCGSNTYNYAMESLDYLAPYRQEAFENPSVPLKALINQCEEIGRTIKPYYDSVYQMRVLDCAKAASDYKIPCSSDKDCEGLCLVELSEEEVKGFDALLDMVKCESIVDEDKRFASCFHEDSYDSVEFITRKGTCSQWSNMQGCYPTAGHKFRDMEIVALGCDNDDYILKTGE
jgi:hypothetical protein